MERSARRPSAGAVRPLVGRYRERTVLRHLVDDARAGHPGVAVVAGAPGAGKTALLGWVAAQAKAGGADVLRSSGYPGALPLDALRRLLAPTPLDGRWPDDGRSPALALASASAPANTDDDGAYARLARWTFTELRALSHRRPVVVLLDDAQDVDAPSQAVLETVLMALDDASADGDVHMLVVLATRAPLEPRGPVDRIVRLDVSRTLMLGGLDTDEVHEMVVAAGLHAAPELLTQLIEDTGGLPLLLEAEIDAVAGSLRRGAVTRDDRSHLRVRSIADLLRLRLEQVDPAARTLLTHAAVLGEPCDVDELVAVVGDPRALVDERLAQADRARLVERSDAGAVRFTHPLIRTEVLRRLGAAERRAAHREAARRLRALHDRPASPDSPDRPGGLGDHATLRIADHLVRAQPDAPAAEVADMALRAGRIAAGWRSWRQASRLLSAAAAAVEAQVGGDGRERHDLARCCFEAGQAAYFDLDAVRCEAQLGRAVEVATEVGDDGLRLRAATYLALARLYSRGTRLGTRPDVRELEDALALTPADHIDPAWRIDGAAVLADALLAVPDTDRALALLAASRPIGQGKRGERGASTSTELESSLSRLEFSEGIHHMSVLDTSEAAACFERSLTHATAAGNTLREIAARSRRAMLGLLRGEVERAGRVLGELEERALHHGYLGEAGLAAACRAFAATLAGSRSTDERIEKATRLYRRHSYVYVAAIVAPAAAANTARLRGRPSPSGGVGARMAPPAGSDQQQPELPSSSAVAALAALEAGDVAAAEVHLDAAGWRHGFRGAATLNNLAVLAALIEVGDRRGNGRLVETAMGPLRRLYETGVLVLLGWPTTVPRLLAVASRRVGELTDARRYLDHALALADREVLRAERAKVLFELARLEHAEGRSAPRVRSTMTAAVRELDGLAMHGWVASAEDVAVELGFASAARAATGDRTIFTNDIVGSTATNTRLGDAGYLEQLRVHDRLVRAGLQRFHGLEIKHTGDGINAVFDDPSDATRCALTVQADFARWEAAEPEMALRIRCGLARGRLIPHNGDFFGLVQSEAARLCSLAGAGEVLVSAAVVADLDAGAMVVERLGPHELRGLPAPVEVVRISEGAA